MARDIKGDTTEIKTGTREIRGAVADASAKLEELLALAKAGRAFDRAREEGIPEAAVRAIVERLGGRGIGREDLLPWLNNWIEAARRRELGRRGIEDKSFEAAWQEAERRFRAGRSNASSALMEEFEREEEAEIERQEERKRRSVGLLEAAIRFDELQLETVGAVDKLRRMAAIEGRRTPREIGKFLCDHAVEFYKRGDEHGENPALLLSIATFRAVLFEWTRERVPLDWAATEDHLGAALARLGERERGTVWLEKAVEAFRAALEEYTRERVPFYWATTQSNLSSALLRLGERESGTERLEEAIAACRASLEVWTRERGSLIWATTQSNLGNALVSLGRREGRTVRLEEAVAAFRETLKERTRSRVPLDWAATQNNLGTALATLGEQENVTGRLEEAVEAFRAALEEYTRERVPFYWATTQYNLGNALASLGEVSIPRQSRGL
jgi:tetratricopeptide (TPR) repeat protein